MTNEEAIKALDEAYVVLSDRETFSGLPGCHVAVVGASQDEDWQEINELTDAVFWSIEAIVAWALEHGYEPKPLVLSDGDFVEPSVADDEGDSGR